jgi:hypothetical protein
LKDQHVGFKFNKQHHLLCADALNKNFAWGWPWIKWTVRHWVKVEIHLTTPDALWLFQNLKRQPYEYVVSTTFNFLCEKEGLNLWTLQVGCNLVLSLCATHIRTRACLVKMLLLLLINVSLNRAW